MTIEEKAKRYDEALEKAKGIHSFSSDIAEIKRMEQIFPELAESEDEKTRKELIQFIKNWKDPNNIGRPHDFPTLTRNVEQCDRYIAWLEKQKEFVSADFDDVWDTADCDELTAPLEKYSKDAIKEMCHAWYDKGIELERKSWLEKQGVQKQDPCEHCKDKCLNCHNFPCITKREFERDKSGMEVIKEEKVDNAERQGEKPKWGDDDEQYLLVCKNALHKYQVSDKWDADIISKWLDDKLKQGEQKPKWSEEDDYNVHCCIAKAESDIANGCTGRNKELIDWLKSLKQRMEG